MKYGFIRVGTATPHIHVANPTYNGMQIEAQMEEAYAAGVQVLVFPELCLSGYTCGDLFLQSALLSACLQEGARLVAASKGKQMLTFVGLPVAVDGKLYNCALAFSDGEPIALIPKSFLPNYGEFYERRHFEPAPQSGKTITLFGKQVAFGRNLLLQDRNCPELIVGCEICEDLWIPESPSVDQALRGATLIVNLSASDEVIGKADYRRTLVKAQSGKLVCGYVYASAGDGESTTDMVFAGHNLIAENGSILRESALFENGLQIAEIDVQKLCNERRRMTTFAEREGIEPLLFETPVREGKLTNPVLRTPFVPQGTAELDERAGLILSMQAKGLEQRLAHTKAKTAVIGISGGLDSALAFLVTVRAFTALGWDRQNIIAVTMPGFGTTGKTYHNALRLIDACGAQARTVPIGDAVLQHFKDIGHDPAQTDVTYENAQARTRTLILMDLANQTGGLVIGTGDLSELALGWATYNGDHMSMYAVNASVPKTLVKYLVRHEGARLGGEAKQVLEDILDTEISPELLPPSATGEIAQKTEDLVGPYELHDFYLYYAVRWGFPPDKVEYLARQAFAGQYDDETLHRWLVNFYRRFFAQQFKRSCLPDGVKVGSVTLSPRSDWRMPSDADPMVWLRLLER